MQLTRRLIKRAAREDADPWRIINEVLYDLCRRYPHHVNDAEIVAKVLMIGRVYSASLERGRRALNADLTNDRFYNEAVAKLLRGSDLDARLQELDTPGDIDESNITGVLSVHAYLVRLFEKLTSKGKRSLASKYLHFHLPHLFFIYDSRARSGIRTLGHECQPVRETAGADVDRQYARFVAAALSLREHIAAKFGIRLSPRQLDRLLLATYAATRA